MPKQVPRETEVPLKPAATPVMWQMDASALIAGGLCSSAINEVDEVTKPIYVQKDFAPNVGANRKCQEK